MQMFNPPHPGRIIKDALASIPMTVTEFAEHICVSRVALSRVINERAGVTPEMSMKISEAFELASPDLLFKVQGEYDFWHASRSRRKKVRPIHTKVAKAA
jgi:addiction module HigA family antidote